MAAPYRLDLAARGNATLVEIITLALDGAPYDLTGCTLAAEFRLPGDISAGAPLINLTNQTSALEGVSIYGTDPTQGQVYLQINQATLQALLTAQGVPELQLWWDLRVTRSAAEIDVPLEGALTLTWGATR